jgi:hypothetical protein
MTVRDVPDYMTAAWETATTHRDPLTALGATRALVAHLARWEEGLVHEAVEAGATWETVGDAVGVSRQAAWERFHRGVHELIRELHDHHHEEHHRRGPGRGRRRRGDGGIDV